MTKQMIENLMNGVKNLTDAKKVLRNNEIEYEVFDGLLSTELKIYNGNETYRIIPRKNNCVEVKCMIKVTIGGAEANLKAQLIQNKLSYR